MVANKNQSLLNRPNRTKGERKWVKNDFLGMIQYQYRLYYVNPPLWPGGKIRLFLLKKSMASHQLSKYCTSNCICSMCCTNKIYSVLLKTLGVFISCLLSKLFRSRMIKLRYKLERAGDVTQCKAHAKISVSMRSQVQYQQQTHSHKHTHTHERTVYRTKKIRGKIEKEITI